MEGDLWVAAIFFTGQITNQRVVHECVPIMAHLPDIPNGDVLPRQVLIRMLCLGSKVFAWAHE